MPHTCRTASRSHLPFHRGIHSLDSARPPLRARRCWATLAAGLAIAALAPVQPATSSEPAPTRPPLPSAVVLFDGTDTSHWVRRGSMEPSPWKIEDGAWIAQVRDIA